MSQRSIILIGIPDSGKTNYLACLWKALQSRTCALIAPNVPAVIKYVEGALAHILQGKFAPRSLKNFEERKDTLAVPVLEANHQDETPVEIVVPDVAGELWKAAVETYEIPAVWMEQLQAASGALLFVRVLSKQNVVPLDWVTSARLLRLGLGGPDPAPDEEHQAPQDSAEEDIAEATGAQEASIIQDNGENTSSEVDAAAVDEKPSRIPTQVALCELLRFVEDELAEPEDGPPRRVAILITAWDMLNAETAEKGPMAYLQTEYPLFAGRLAELKGVECKAFGVSAVGGDFADPIFLERFLEEDLVAPGYVVEGVEGRVTTHNDITLPVAWVIRGEAT